jgi:hypothetical protein
VVILDVQETPSRRIVRRVPNAFNFAFAQNVIRPAICSRHVKINLILLAAPSEKSDQP